MPVAPRPHKPTSHDRRAAAGLGSDGRASRSSGVGVLAALEGFVLIVWHVLATPFIGRGRQRWGTIGTEATDSLPGDESVPEPKWSNTLGISIDATPQDVWPWIVQLGQGRGGFYSYQTLENLFGCEITNTTRILPDYQHPEVGDGIRLFADGPPLRMEIVAPPNALAFYGSPTLSDDDQSWGESTWQFVVNPGPNGESSRFLVRGRYDHGPTWKSRLMFGRFPLEAISFVMNRKMMLEIKRLAELPA